MSEQNADNRFFLLDRSGTIAEMNLIDILPLITVWLQVRVRVLPGPPAFAGFASYGLASHPLAQAAAPELIGRRRLFTRVSG
jgi:hypothetical protein